MQNRNDNNTTRQQQTKNTITNSDNGQAYNTGEANTATRKGTTTSTKESVAIYR